MATTIPINKPQNSNIFFNTKELKKFSQVDFVLLSTNLFLVNPESLNRFFNGCKVFLGEMLDKHLKMFSLSDSIK